MSAPQSQMPLVSPTSNLFSALFQAAGARRGNMEVQNARDTMRRNFMNWSDSDKVTFTALLIASGYTYPWTADAVDAVVENNVRSAVAAGAGNSTPIQRMVGGKEIWKTFMRHLWSGVKIDYQHLGTFCAGLADYCEELGKYFYSSGGLALNGIIPHSKFFFRCLTWEQTRVIMRLQIDSCVAVIVSLPKEFKDQTHQIGLNPWKSGIQVPFPQLATDFDATMAKVRARLSGQEVEFLLEDHMIIANINKPSVYLTNKTVALAGGRIPDPIIGAVEEGFEILCKVLNDNIKFANGPNEWKFGTAGSYDTKAGMSAAYQMTTSYVQFITASARAGRGGGVSRLVRNEPRTFTTRGTGEKIKITRVNNNPTFMNQGSLTQTPYGARQAQTPLVQQPVTQYQTAPQYTQTQQYTYPNQYGMPIQATQGTGVTQVITPQPQAQSSTSSSAQFAPRGGSNSIIPSGMQGQLQAMGIVPDRL